MLRHSRLLTTAVQVVVFLFSSFGGTLRRLAPPQSVNADQVVGILSFLVLILLLMVSGISRTLGRRAGRYWIAAGATAFVLALVPAYQYPVQLRRHTWEYPPGSGIQRLKGLESDFTPEVREYLATHPGAGEDDPTRLARNFELAQIWSPASLEAASRRLLLLYSWLVLALATAVFCLIEANVQPAGRSRSRTRSQGTRTPKRVSA